MSPGSKSVISSLKDRVSQEKAGLNSESKVPSRVFQMLQKQLDDEESEGIVFFRPTPFLLSSFYHFFPIFPTSAMLCIVIILYMSYLPSNALVSVSLSRVRVALWTRVATANCTHSYARTHTHAHARTQARKFLSFVHTRRPSPYKAQDMVNARLFKFNKWFEEI